ncbi:MAG: nucleotidyltransferase domain-containing protein [Thiobacillus sp.]|nr:nucleotidyltransferase domain-containing protein [Thiobacillus sp.]
MPYGLPEDTLTRIRDVLAAHPAVEKAVLYGSRAKGGFRAGSDIDLCLVGEAVSLPEQLKIESELDDLLLPYKIDLSRYHALDTPALVDHIKRVGVAIYEAASHAREETGWQP